MYAGQPMPMQPMPMQHMPHTMNTMHPENLALKQSGNIPFSASTARPINMGANILPFIVSQELNQYKKVYISRQFDFFRNFQCCELAPDYVIYGEMPDGDKKILFTCRQNYKCCECCCSQCIISCLFCEYICCDKIIFQMDYKRNNANFYTQGINMKKGCYCCKCYCLAGLCCCCPCCINKNILHLRENVDPDNPDPTIGSGQGTTEGVSCCSCIRDKTVSYNTQEGFKGPLVRLGCCVACKDSCFCQWSDIEIDIEDGEGKKTDGSILVPNGCCSQRGTCCFRPIRHFEITFPQNSSSIEKFQIIADTIHLDLDTGILKSF